jgi:hypothetical protein
MSQSNVWFRWILIFLSFIALGGGIGYFFMLSLRPDFVHQAPLKINNQLGPVAVKNVKNTYNHQYEPVLNHQSRPKLDLKNPFVIPNQYYQKSGLRSITQRKQAFIEYQGIIETDNNVLGLVKLTNTNETFVVYEGEIIVELGLEIRKITPKTLTYSKDRVEAVISLGGIQH